MIDKELLDFLESRFSKLDEGFSDVKQQVASLQEDVSGLKEDVGTLKVDVSGLKEDVGTLKGQFAKMEEKFDVLQETAEITRASVNKLLAWTDEISSVDTFPLPKVQ